jgi:hypothetical protein
MRILYIAGELTDSFPKNTCENGPHRNVGERVVAVLLVILALGPRGGSNYAR